MPKFVKLTCKKKELLLLKVDKLDKGYYYGWVDNKPITTKTLKCKQYIKVNKHKVVDTK